MRNVSKGGREGAILLTGGSWPAWREKDSQGGDNLGSLFKEKYVSAKKEALEL